MPLEVKKDPFLSYVWRRANRKDRNVLMIICGEVGSCKSGSAISIAHWLDRTGDGRCRFTLDRIVFKAEDFLKLVRSKLPKGSVIIWDEAGVDADNLDYYTQKSKLIKHVFQTFRYKNLVVILTVPDLSSIQIGMRRLLHVFVTTFGPNSDLKTANANLELIQTNPKTGKVYFKHIRFSDKQGRYCELEKYVIPRPPRKFEEAYKLKKNKITNRMYKEFNKEIAFMNRVVEAEENIASDMNRLEKEILKRPKDYMNARKRFSTELIEQRLGDRDMAIGSTMAGKLARLLNTKVGRGDINV
jgi:hypothetical protein